VVWNEGLEQALESEDFKPSNRSKPLKLDYNIILFKIPLKSIRFFIEIPSSPTNDRISDSGDIKFVKFIRQRFVFIFFKSKYSLDNSELPA